MDFSVCAVWLLLSLWAESLDAIQSTHALLLSRRSVSVDIWPWSLSSAVVTKQEHCFLMLPDDTIAFSSPRGTFPAGGVSQKAGTFPCSPKNATK